MSVEPRGGEAANAPSQPEAPTRVFDEDDERFFLAEGCEGSLAPTELVVAASDAQLEDDDPVPRSRAERLASPRRRALARWVSAVVAVFAVFCVAAFATKRGPAPALAAPSPPPPPAPPAPPAPVVTQVETAAPAPPPAAPPETSTKPDGRALALREVARAALSRGALDVSVERGFESVELDPSDAEAWLVLGAAQMAKGQSVEARSTFAACTKIATHGPRAECFQMLQ